MKKRKFTLKNGNRYNLPAGTVIKEFDREEDLVVGNKLCYKRYEMYGTGVINKLGIQPTIITYLDDAAIYLDSLTYTVVEEPALPEPKFFYTTSDVEAYAKFCNTTKQNIPIDDWWGQRKQI